MADLEERKGGSSNRLNLKANLVWKKGEQRKINGGTLVGRLITEKSFNKITTIQMIRKGWNLERNEDLEITEVESNAFIFEFRRKEEYLRILRGRPWSIQGTLLNIQLWRDFMVYKDVNFVFSPFWIQFHDLPLEGMELENAITLGSLIGEVVMVEDPRKNKLLNRCFLRARILVDIRKPLVSGMWTFKPDKEKIWIKARYERLQNFCYKCGRLGHDKRVCAFVNSGDGEEEEEEYGSWLGVQAARLNPDNICCLVDGWEEHEGIMYQGRQGGCRDGNEGKARADSSNDIWRKEIGGNREKESEERVVANKAEIVEDKMKQKKENRAGLIRGEKKEENEERVEQVKEDLSKAIVVYGSCSPVSEVMKGLRKICLKREREEEGVNEVTKRRRMIFEEVQKESTPLKKGIMNKGGRRNLRTLKRQGRRGMKSSEEGRTMLVDDIGICGMSGAITEGLGGWPETTTKGP